MAADSSGSQLGEFEERIERMREGAFLTPSHLLENGSIKKLLVNLNQADVVGSVAVLLTDPMLHANTVRIEVLVHLALVAAVGCENPTVRVIDLLLNRELRDTVFATWEDPVEDVFVYNVVTEMGNKLLLGGLWEDSAACVQRTYNVMLTLPKDTESTSLICEVESILKLSDEIVNRRGLHRYQAGGGEPRGNIALPSDTDLVELRRTIQFTEEDFTRLGFSKDDIEPFVFPDKSIDDLRDVPIEGSELHNRPIVSFGKSYVIVLPGSVGHAVVNHILEWMVQHSYERSFDENLLAEYQQLLANTPFFGPPPPLNVIIPSRTKKGVTLLETMKEVDEGRFCQMIAVPSGLRTPFGDSLIDSAELEERIRTARDSVRGRRSFVQGFTVVIVCGVGLPTMVELPEEFPDWWVVSASADDYGTLMTMEPSSGFLLWKMLQQLHDLEGHGLRFMNPNGLLNLFAYWEDNKFLLLPSVEEIDKLPDIIAIPTDSCFEVRARHRRGHDVHAVRDPDGRLRLVRRKTVESYFPSDSERPLYVSPSDAKEGILLGLYQGRTNWWVQAQQGKTALERGTVYRLWDCVTNWLSHIALVFESDVTLPSGRQLEFVLDLDQCSGFQGVGAENPPIVEVLPYEISPANGAIRIPLTDDFMALFNVPQNSAERAIVSTIVESACRSMGHPCSTEDIKGLVGRIMPNGDMRYFHVFQAQTFREMIRRENLPETILVDKANSASARIGLAWGLVPGPPYQNIESVEEAVSFLRTVVDKIFNRIQSTLRRFDRKKVILDSLSMIESIQGEMQQWQATSRAVLSFREKDPTALETIVDHLSECKGSKIALRLVAEMALQEAPTSGGMSPGRIDLANLMADALLLFHLGGASDAIKRQVMPPQIRIGANGDIAFSDDFYKVVADFGIDFGNAEVDQHSASYEQNFEVREPVASVEGRLPAAFRSAFAAEFGLSIDQLMGFIETMENHALTLTKPIFEATDSAIRAICQESQYCDSASARAALDNFTLKHRGGFDKIPIGFEKSDWYPWRFRRRLSLISKPLVEYEVNETPTLIISPGLLREGISVFLSRYFEGSVPAHEARSREMKQWLTDEASRRAHQLVVDVADALAGFGLETRLEKSLGELLGEKVDNSFGDVDVFAWRRGTNQVFAIECKDIQLAKTVTEMAEQLRRFSGQFRDGKKDDLLKHLTRCLELQKRSKGLERNTPGVVTPIVVRCVVCFSRPVAIKYVQSRFPEVRFLTLQEIRMGSTVLGGS